MATQTTNLGLIKPAGTDYVLVSDFNTNADTLDTAIGDLDALQTMEKGSLVGAINDAMDSASVTVNVGTTTTGNAGTNASVTNVGTDKDAVFNFTIPRGDPGVSVTVGTTTTGAAGSSASVSNSGTASDPILDFTVPRGANGVGVPAEGMAGQVLAKASAADYDTEWIDAAYATSEQGALADTAVQPETIAMLSSGGVFSGGAVTAQGSPDQTVAVAAVSILTPEGKRYVVSAVSSLAAAAADATHPRIDIVYVSSVGVVTYLAGTAAASPVQPATPTNGTILAAITRPTNDNTIATGDITDKRTFITTRLTKGTWTPVVTPVAGAITSYTIHEALFRVADDMVTFFVTITITNKGTGAGGFYFTLPFAVSGSSAAYGREQATSGKMLQGYLTGNSALVLDYANGDPIATNGLYIISGAYIKA